MSTKDLGEMDLTLVQKGETLVKLSETGIVTEKENVKQERNLIHKTKTEILALVELQGGIPEIKMAADGVSFQAKQEKSATATLAIPYHKEIPQAQPLGYQ